MRAKLGTVLDERIFSALKQRALKEGRTISEIIQDALQGYFHSSPREASLRLKAVTSLCSHAFALKPRDLEAIIHEDPLDS